MTDHLAVYLNDHLAGSTTATELLTTLEAEPGFEHWAKTLRAEVESDRRELEGLMIRAGTGRSAARRAAGWIAEKLAEAKERTDDGQGGPLYLLELVEALALGIDGKRALWLALQAASLSVPALQGMDYPHLIGRAIAQRAAVEPWRQRLAEQAFCRAGRPGRPKRSRARNAMMAASGAVLGAALASQGLRSLR